MDSAHSSGWSCCSTPGEKDFHCGIWLLVELKLFCLDEIDHFGQKRGLQPNFVVDAEVPVVRVNLKQHGLSI